MLVAGCHRAKLTCLLIYIRQYQQCADGCGAVRRFEETVMSTPNLWAIIPASRAWNRGRIIDRKRLVLPKHVWAIRARLELAENKHDHALFNVAMDSNIRGCDLVL